MSMNLESVKNALGRFECSFEGDYPEFEEMCLIEARSDGKEAKENDESLELSFFGNKIGIWLQRPGKPTHPITRVELEGVVTVRLAKELFALTLAAAVAGGHLDALKKDGNNVNLQAFLDSKGYQEALTLGNKILADLKAAPGDTLKAKLKVLNLQEIKGTVGELNFLEKVLRLDLKNLGPQAASSAARSEKPLDVELREIEKIDIPVRLPPLAAQIDSKARALAEIRALEYVGLGYPLERNVKGKPSSPNERRAMRFIKDIYDPNIALELLKDVLSIANVDKNVSCITVELVSKILGSYLDGACTIEPINKALDLLLENTRKIPKWSMVKEDSLRPYIQVLEQLIAPVIALQDQARICQFMIALHRLKTEMLTAHGSSLAVKAKLKGFVDFTETMLNQVFLTQIQNKQLPKALLEDIMQQLLDTHETDARGHIRLEILMEKMQESQVNIHLPVAPAGAAPAAPVRMSQQLLAPVQEERKSASEAQGMILDFIKEMEEGMKVGNKDVIGLGAIMTDIAANNPFTQEELKEIKEKFDQLRTLGRNPAVMRLNLQAINDAIAPCEAFLIQRQNIGFGPGR